MSKRVCVTVLVCKIRVCVCDKVSCVEAFLCVCVIVFVLL